ncbi:DEAD/DEAH box helicase [Paenibacillus sp. FSL M7-0420]|uniref:DEAD/DEAH box helicase n=1 Tax=Paenibacillus sp. FSL M7-0420 TaxID=2921609 RepID=UPI0030F7B48F
MDFTLEDIKDICGDTFYKRGRSYYNSGRVSKLVLDAENNRYTAQVKGSRAYRVQIDFYYNLNGEPEAHCTCPAYENYDCCKHVAATLMAIHALQIKKPAGSEVQKPGSASVASKSKDKRKYNQMDLLISSLAEMKPAMNREKAPLFEHEEQLQFEFILSTLYQQPRGFTLEMRVGYKHRYVVTKLGQFLEHLEQRKPLYFTSKFTFDAEQQQIGAADREFLEVMLLLKNSEKLLKPSPNSYYNPPETDGRTLKVTPLAWDKLKPLLPEVNITLRSVGHPEVPAVLAGQVPPLEFSIGQGKKKDYVLTAANMDKLTLLEDYSTLIMDGLIYDVDRAALRTIALLQQQFTASSDIAVAPGQIEAVVQQVLPALRKLGKVSVEQAVSERIVEPELQAKLYLDYADGTLTFRLEFHYEEIVINPLEENSVDEARKQKILIRNMQRENKIVDILDNSPLRQERQYWVSVSEPVIYEALYELVPVLEEVAELFVSPAVQRLVLERKAYPKVKAELSEGLDWLDISFELEGLNEEETVRVMQAIVEKRKYVRLRSGAFLPIAVDSFSEFGTVAEQLNLRQRDLKHSVIRLPSVQALQLPERGHGFKHTKWGKSLREFLDQLREPDSLEFELPAELKPVLRDYQARGFQWMKTLSKFRFGGILADDMGLGKTIQSIAYICSELAEMPPKVQGRAPVLILCPASLTYNWSHEFARFAPAVNVLVAAGQKEERSGLLESKAMEEADVIITSYPLLRRDIELYSGTTFHALILDEAQAIKNSASQTAQAVKSLKAARKFALTGTPIENSVDELEAIFSTVFPALFTGRLTFKELPAGRIASIVSPFILRRLKKEVLEELPDRIDTVQHTELLDEQKQVYLAYLSRLRDDTEQDLLADGFHKSRMKILAGITRLRQICCHPSLFLENYTGGSGKLEQLLEIVQECRDSGRRMLVFSQFSSMLELIRHRLDEAGVQPLYLDGSTPGKERVELCRLFNEGEGEVFLISLKAGGTGLNLTGADTVILYDLWWNPAVEEQAIGRAHRMGQRNVVQVIRLITEGSIEEKMLELQQRKKDLIEEVIEAGENKTTRLSEEDIRELLRV